MEEYMQVMISFLKIGLSRLYFLSIGFYAWFIFRRAPSD